MGNGLLINRFNDFSSIRNSHPIEIMMTLNCLPTVRRPEEKPCISFYGIHNCVGGYKCEPIHLCHTQWCTDLVAGTPIKLISIVKTLCIALMPPSVSTILLCMGIYSTGIADPILKWYIDLWKWSISKQKKHTHTQSIFTRPDITGKVGSEKGERCVRCWWKADL